MAKVNQIVFKIDVCDYEDKQYEMWGDVADAIRILTQWDYVCLVRQEMTGIVVLEFEPQNREYGYPYPAWIDQEDEFDECRS